MQGPAANDTAQSIQGRIISWWKMEEGQLMAEFDQVRIAHLTMIQGVITRMAGNSFALKTLAVTLTTGVVALLGAIQTPSQLYMLAALLPILMFWWLDARYLQLERLYRRLYDDVRTGSERRPDRH